MTTRRPQPGDADAAPDEWVPVKEAAARAGVSVQAIRKWYRDGSLPVRAVDSPHGPMNLVPLAAVEERRDRWRAGAQPRRPRPAPATAEEALRLAEKAAEAFERLVAERERSAALEARLTEMQRVVEELRAENTKLERKLARSR